MQPKARTWEKNVLRAKECKIEVTLINLENHISGVGVRDPNGNDVEDDHERGADEEGGAATLEVGEGAEEEDADDEPGCAGRVQVGRPGRPEKRN